MNTEVFSLGVKKPIPPYHISPTQAFYNSVSNHTLYYNKVCGVKGMCSPTGRQRCRACGFWEMQVVSSKPVKCSGAFHTDGARLRVYIISMLSHNLSASSRHIIATKGAAPDH